jgi:hypothetical protein
MEERKARCSTRAIAPTRVVWEVGEEFEQVI